MSDANIKKTVLIADDDATSLLLMRQVLENFDYNVIDAKHGGEAMERYYEQRPDAVLLDLHMPEKNGLQVCSEIRVDEAGEHIPILIITGADDVESINAAFSAGATDFLAKPINWHLLGYKIRYVLKNADTQAQKRRAEDLAEQLGTVVENSSNEIFLFGENSLDIKYANASARKNLGYDMDYLSGRSLLELVAKSEKENFVLQMEPVASSEKKEVVFETYLQREDGTGYPVEIRVHRTVQKGAPVHLAIIQDITRRKKTEERMRYLAYYDALTGLPNRQFFKEQLALLIDMVKRSNSKIAVLFIDLDNLKRINDSLGHSVGDLLLKQVAERLKHCIRQSDMVGKMSRMSSQSMISRLGGDEFTLVLNHVEDRKAVDGVVKRIQQGIAAPLHLGGHEIVLTASIGVAFIPDDGGDVETVLKCADTAMYNAKKAGRNSFKNYDKSMEKRSLVRLNLENELRRTLDNNELIVYYQPQINIETGKVIGAEALVRWQHPTEGLVPPDTFVSVAEEAGLIYQLGSQVLDKACGQIKIWEKEGLDLQHVAVNISSVQFQHPDLFGSIMDIISRNGISPRKIELEVTESAMMDDGEKTVQTLRLLRSMNVKIAVDDFGTGYSSLSYLKRFPLNNLKIDKTFISDVGGGRSGEGIVSAIVAMARCLNLGIVAEGVETAEQLSFLKKQGVKIVQGYMLSKPITADQFAKFVQRNSAGQKSY